MLVMWWRCKCLFAYHLINIGAIVGGSCWADPELNSADQISQGKVYFDFDFTPVYPAEHIIFRSHLVNDYIKEIFFLKVFEMGVSKGYS